ncbi:hypothetical protein ABT301_29715 [Streptomyces sp. NPDC000987]|uniref:hypothetical protein n=1 Tax=Streptomyces sp. NPDC000987 TaxID=3154374 RepID=UPI00332449A7
MPSSSRPHGQVPPALADVNDQIRHLMGQPASPHRAEEYSRLLGVWVDLVRGDVDQAA